MRVDIWGKYQIKGWGGTEYLEKGTDDATHMTFRNDSSTKLEFPHARRSMHTKAEKRRNATTPSYRFDGEFLKYRTIANWVLKKGLVIEETVPAGH